MLLSLVNVFVAVLALILVFGGPVGFLIKMVVTGKNPDQILQSAAGKSLSCEKLLHEDHMYEKGISNEAEQEDYGKSVDETAAHGKTIHGKRIHGNKNSGSSERRVS